MIEPSSIHEHIAQVRHGQWQFLRNLGQVDCPVESTIEARNPQIAPGRHSQHSLTAIMRKDAGTKTSPRLQCPNDINHILARHQILVPWTTWISKHLHSAITPIHSHVTVSIQGQRKLTNIDQPGVNHHGERITHRDGSGGRNTRINDTHRRDDGGTRANPRNQACRIDSRNTPVTTLPVNILRNVTVNTHHQVQLPRCTRKELQLNRTDIYSQHLSRTLNRDDYRSGSAAAPLIHHAISEFNRLTLTPGKRIKRTERIERDQASIGIKSHVRNRFNAADRQHTTGRTHVIRQQLLNRQHQRQIIHRHCEGIIHSHRTIRRNYLNLMLSRHALTKAILNREHRNNRINGRIGVAQRPGCTISLGQVLHRTAITRIKTARQLTTIIVSHLPGERNRLTYPGVIKCSETGNNQVTRHHTDRHNPVRLTGIILNRVRNHVTTDEPSNRRIRERPIRSNGVSTMFTHASSYRHRNRSRNTSSISQQAGSSVNHKRLADTNRKPMIRCHRQLHDHKPKLSNITQAACHNFKRDADLPCLIKRQRLGSSSTINSHPSQMTGQLVPTRVIDNPLKRDLIPNQQSLRRRSKTGYVQPNVSFRFRCALDRILKHQHPTIRQPDRHITRTSRSEIRNSTCDLAANPNSHATATGQDNRFNIANQVHILKWHTTHSGTKHAASNTVVQTVARDRDFHPGADFTRTDRNKAR